MKRRDFVQLTALASTSLAAAAGAAWAAPDAGGRTLYAIVYRAGPAWRVGRPMREQGLAPHARRMKQLFDDGVLFAGGPMGEDGGLALVWAADAAQAAKLLADDPAVIAGIFTAEAQPWRPRFRRDEALPG
jgi:uncharacterized protein YciI